MRDALQGRMDESDGVKREMREVVAEKKGELKVEGSLPGHSWAFLSCLLGQN